MKKNKRICSMLLASMLFAGTCVTPVMAADLGTSKVYSKSNPAVFNGTTNITVPSGTKVDFAEAEYRIFANDFEDGDCTPNIKIVSNNYKDRAGSYQVKYQVTDSHNNTSTKTVNIRVKLRGDKSIEKTLYTLPATSNMDLVGTQRGNNHDRQNIGLYMKAGQQIKIRQKSTSFGQDLKLSLDTDDSQTGKSVTIPKSGSWVTVTAGADCVPSIMTPKNAGSNPVVEITYNNSIESLNYYRYQDDQAKFFSDWDASGASYAVLETERATLLVPKKDRSNILASHKVDDAVTWELDVFKNAYGQIDENVANAKHLAFIKGDEVNGAMTPAPHYQEKALPTEFLDTNVSMKLSWNAQSQQLTYRMNPVSNTSNVITDTFAFNPKNEMGANEAYLLISATSGMAGTFAFELTSFENGSTKISKFNDLFANPLGNGYNNVQGNKISFTKDGRQLGAINTKNKIDLSKNFVLNGIVTIAHDSDGMAFTLHNDARGNNAIGFNNSALGVFGMYGDADYYGFKSIDELLEFYNDFSEEFDEYMGLAYDTDNLLNQNVRTKYFVKADKNGVGGAYYGAEHTAQNADSIAGFLKRNWMSIHEFGHGYEGRLARQELALVDVLNNVLGYYVEQGYKNPSDAGWMGRKQNIEKEIAGVRNNLTDYHSYNQMDYRDRLYSIVNLLDKIGSKESMAALHTMNRDVTKKGIYYNATDLFAKAFSESSGMNVVPYLESWKLMPSAAEKANVFEKDLPILYYLRDCVESDAKATELMKSLNCDGIYSLVTVDDLKKYNLTGNLEMTLSIDDLNQLKGKKLLIKNGKEVVKEVVITDSKLIVENLPVGAYEIEVSNTKTPYLYDYQYVVISNGKTTTKEINYQKNFTSIDSDMRIDFLGLADKLFATVSYDKASGNLEVITNSGQPHLYYAGRAYANVKVSRGSKTLYSREYIGDTQNASKNDKIAVKVGDKVTIWHDEATSASSRLKAFGVMTNRYESAFAPKDKTVEYIVTKYGLMPASYSETAQYNLYKQRVEKYAEMVDARIPEEYKDNVNAYPVEKNLLKQAVSLLNDADRKALESKYDKLLNGSEPEEIPVDKTKLQGLLEDAKTYESEIDKYTPETAEAFRTALAAAKEMEAKEEATQEEVDAACAELEKAIAELELLPVPDPVDKTRLQELLENAKTYEAEIDKYTPETAEAFQTALAAAKEMEAKEEATQEEVDAACAELEKAIAELELLPEPDPVDKTRLQGLLEDAKTYESEIDKYTPETAEAFQTALALAKEVEAKEEATQEEVDAAYAKLEKAIAELELLPEPDPVDKTKLQGLLEDAKTYEAEIDKYTPETAEAFQTALAAAKEVEAKEEATQEEVDAVYAELEKAIAELELVPEPDPVDKTRLQELLENAKTYEAEIAKYTQETAKAFQTALAEAKEVEAKEEATQEEVDAAYAELEKAIAELELVPEPDPVDKTRLQGLLEDAKTYEAEIDKYTPETAEAFQTALAAAREVEAKEEATQEEVDAAYAELEKAITELKLLPNKDALKAAIKEAEKIDLTKYTDKSTATLKSALKTAKEVMADNNASEEAVNRAEKDLNAAIDGLELKSNGGGSIFDKIWDWITGKRNRLF